MASIGHMQRNPTHTPPQHREPCRTLAKTGRWRPKRAISSSTNPASSSLFWMYSFRLKKLIVTTDGRGERGVGWKGAHVR